MSTSIGCRVGLLVDFHKAQNACRSHSVYFLIHTASFPSERFLATSITCASVSSPQTTHPNQLGLFLYTPAIVSLSTLKMSSARTLRLTSTALRPSLSTAYRAQAQVARPAALFQPRHYASKGEGEKDDLGGPGGQEPPDPQARADQNR